jgi:BMFP domain-containing protein YqiC
MQTQNRLLDDLARVASGALGVAAGMRAEVETRLREQFERVLAGLDLVPREEFDAVKAMAIKAREEQEVLAERLARLEAALGATLGAKAETAKPRKSAGKAAAGKTAGAKGAARKAAGKDRKSP